MSTTINEWLDMMPDTVTVYAFVSRSSAGTPTFSSTSTDYQCRISMQNHLIVDKQGREILAKGSIIMGSAVIIGIEDKVVLPSDYVPTNPPILAVNIVSDESGSHHTTVEIG